MSEYKTEQDRIDELENKIHQLKMEELLKIEYITGKSKEVVEKLSKLDEDLTTTQKKLDDCDLKEVRRWEVIIKCIKTRKDVLTGFKQVLHEARLSIKLLMLKEEQLEFRKVKLESSG